MIWLTTEDNPYDYFTDFERWYMFDVEKGYNTCGLVARLASTSEELSEVDNENIIEAAIHAILDANVPGNYVLIEN